jgi:CBS domain containing-hemolysin-like protein
MNWETIIVIGLKLAGVLVLVMLNGFFVAAELALVRVRETQLGALASRGNRRAQAARRMVSNISVYIGATQLGITLVSLGMGAVVEPFFHESFRPLFDWLQISSPRAQFAISMAAGFFINSYLLIVLGELVPKVIAIHRTVPTALAVAAPLRAFYLLAFPFIWLLNRSSQWFLGLLGFEDTDEIKHLHSEEELRLMISTAQTQTGATVLGRTIVLNALDLRHRVARQVMQPRQEIVSFDTDSSMAECLDLAEKSRYSRFPLCEAGGVDHMVGVVHIKDLYAMRLKARSGAELVPVAKKLVYVPESARLERVLQLLLERKLHMAVVVDEYGGTLGLLTLENILEELVGQIQDEFDQEKPLQVRVSESSWEVSGALPLHELEEIVGEPLAAGEMTTVNGLVTQRLGGFPKVGDTLHLGACELRVEEMDGMRVSRLSLTKRPGTAEVADGI